LGFFTEQEIIHECVRIQSKKNNFIKEGSVNCEIAEIQIEDQHPKIEDSSNEKEKNGRKIFPPDQNQTNKNKDPAYYTNGVECQQLIEEFTFFKTQLSAP